MYTTVECAMELHSNKENNYNNNRYEINTANNK